MHASTLTDVHVCVIACELVSKSVCSNVCMSVSHYRSMAVANCVPGREPVLNCVRNSLRANYRTCNVVLFKRIKVTEMVKIPNRYLDDALKGCSNTQFRTGYTHFPTAFLRSLLQDDTPFATGTYAICYRKLRRLLQEFWHNPLNSFRLLDHY